LYLVGAGLFSRGVWHLETQKWNNAIGGDASETGTGAGSYDIDKSVWHVNVSSDTLDPERKWTLQERERNANLHAQCCSPTTNDDGWGVFNAILGWQNSATYGSVISYNVYWICVMAGFILMRFNEVKGHWPFMKPKAAAAPTAAADDESRSGSSSQHGGAPEKSTNVTEKTTVA
jgi:high-affinity iron transporter